MSQKYIKNMIFKNLIYCTCVCAFIISGCSSKKHFEPKIISGKVNFSDKLSAPIKSATREGAILKDNTLVSYTRGITPIILESNHKFLAEDKNTYVLQKGCGEILIMESAHDFLQSIPFDKCALSADIKGNELALVLIDNTIVYYDIAQKKRAFLSKTFACPSDKLLYCFTANWR